MQNGTVDIQTPPVILSELWVIWNSLYQDFSFYKKKERPNKNELSTWIEYSEKKKNNVSKKYL